MSVKSLCLKKKSKNSNRRTRAVHYLGLGTTIFLFIFTLELNKNVLINLSVYLIGELPNLYVNGEIDLLFITFKKTCFVNLKLTARSRI